VRKDIIVTKNTITLRRDVNHTKVGFYHVCQASFDFAFKPIELLSFQGDANK